MSTKSNFHTVEKQDCFTKSSFPLEEQDIKSLVENCLKEFKHTSDSKKKKYRKEIRKWLKKQKGNTEFVNIENAIRDFIYEMY